MATKKVQQQKEKEIKEEVRSAEEEKYFQINNYFEVMCNEFIEQDKDSGIYYLNPMAFIAMKCFNLIPNELNIDITFDEIKEALKLEVEKRNKKFDILYETISTIKKGLENMQELPDLSSLTEEVVKANPEIAQKLPYYNQMNFSKKNV